MKKLLFILLLTIPFVGFGQSDTIKKYYDNGQLMFEGNTIDGEENGLWKEYYENGNNRSKWFFQDGIIIYNDCWSITGIPVNCIDSETLTENSLPTSNQYINGEKDGLWITYWDEGTPRYVDYMKDGKRHGPFTWYWENGNISGTGNYIEGKENGIYTQYNRDGSLRSEETYTDGKYDGVSKYYSNYGKVFIEKVFKENKQISIQCFDKNGNKVEPCDLKYRHRD